MIGRTFIHYNICQFPSKHNELTGLFEKTPCQREFADSVSSHFASDSKSELGMLPSKAQTKTGPRRTPDRLLVCLSYQLLEEEVRCEACTNRVFIATAFKLFLSPQNFPAHAHLLDRLPHDVGVDLVHLVFGAIESFWLPKRFNIAELGVEGRGFGQAERQTNGEGESFERVAIDCRRCRSLLRTRTCWSADLHRSQRQRSGLQRQPG
jgi:hypothetical protein